MPTSGYFVQAAYLITGETLRERTVIDPIDRFDLRPGKFGLGAFEPHARYSEMSLGRQVFTAGLADPNLWTNRVQMIDVGLNWYLNKFVKSTSTGSTPCSPRRSSPGSARTAVPLSRSPNDLFWVRFQFYF